MKKRFLSIVLILSIILSFNTIISFAGTLEEDDVINENNIELYYISRFAGCDCRMKFIFRLLKKKKRRIFGQYY